MKGTNKVSLKKIIHIIGKIISWVLFVLLMITAVFLLYYYVATKVYTKKGHGYEPKFSIYTIISQSMTPNIKVYDAVVDIRVDDPTNIEVGDVITFISTSLLTPGMTITHRVKAITTDSSGQVCYVTKGDYNSVEDDSCAKFNNILGKVMFKIPQIGRVQKLLASKAGWLLFIMLPALFIISKDIVKMAKLAGISDKASKVSEKPKPDEKKIAQEKLRKEELKRKLLKEEDRQHYQEYYKDPVIRTIDKRKNKDTNISKTNNIKPKVKNKKNNKNKKKS